MNKLLLYIFCIFMLFQCINEKVDEQPYKEYFRLDIAPKTDKLYSPRRKAKIPFQFNKIYDPFITNDSIQTVKSVFKKGKYNKLRVLVLDTVYSTINVAKRNKRKKIVTGIPVIISNNAINNTNYLLLHRGCAMLIQEAKDKNGEWKEIERFTKEKLGNFHYKILPKEYIYTKVPRYRGTFETSFRVKLKLDTDKFIYSNEYKGMIQPWMIR